MREFQVNIRVEHSVFTDISALHESKYSGMYRGVYVMYGANNEVLYVGKTTDLAQRLRGHRRDSAFYRDIQRLELFKCPDMFHMELLETILINDLKPRHNKSKTYFKSQDYSRVVGDIDYEIGELKQEISYLEQDIEMYKSDLDFEYDYDGFSLESEIEPIKEEIERLNRCVKELQSEKHRLLMRMN